MRLPILIGTLSAALYSLACAGPAEVRVADFGAIPGDTICDAAAIRRAFDYAKQHDIKRVVFGAGDYFLREKSPGGEDFTAHIHITGFPGLEIIGAVDEQGRPATRLVRHNPCLNQTNLGGHLRVDDCPGLTIKNLELDNYPRYATAGQVTQVRDDTVFVRVFDGLPVVDGMAAYCMNAWDLDTRDLMHRPSLTYGSKQEIDAKNAYWYISSTDPRQMYMKSRAIAEQCGVGDGLSWHFGALTFFQLNVNTSDDLVMENITMPNIAGFGIQVSGCRNVTCSGIGFRADGGQLAVGPRDAFKIHMCDGIVDISDMYVEGVRWDGQNVHAAFWVVNEQLSDTTFLAWKKYNTLRPLTGDSISLWTGTGEARAYVRDLRRVDSPDGGCRAVFTVDGLLPAITPGTTLVASDRWDCDEYILRNSTFRNIAGCASIIKNKKVTLSGNTYDNIMYPALVLGAEITDHYEGTFPRDVTVRGCTFSRSGWESRNGTRGLVGIGNSGYEGNVIGNITFEGCTFTGGATGIDIRNARQVVIQGCTFDGVGRPYSVQDGTPVQTDM